MQPCRYDASAARPLVGGSLGANPRLLEVGAVLLILWAIAIRDLWEEAHMIDTLVRLVPVGTLALTAVSVISSPPPDQGSRRVWPYQDDRLLAVTCGTCVARAVRPTPGTTGRWSSETNADLRRKTKSGRRESNPHDQLGRLGLCH